MIALVLMGALIAGECVVAAIFLSSANESLATAQKMAEPEPDVQPDEPLDTEDGFTEDLANRTEVDLWQYSITSYQASTNVTLHIDFSLYGTVDNDDAGEFARLLEENQHRFRNQVITIIRSATLTDLSDPGLGLIKRKILTTTNRTFGKNILKEVVFSDFSFYEQ